MTPDEFINLIFMWLPAALLALVCLVGFARIIRDAFQDFTEND